MNLHAGTNYSVAVAPVAVVAANLTHTHTSM